MTAPAYLLDTNVCIDFLLGRSAVLADRMAGSFGALTVSAVTAGELRVGNRSSSEPGADGRRIDSFLSLLRVAPFDDAATRVYAEVVRQAGVRRNSFDRLIGAHALALAMVLVTRNPKDFVDIPGLKMEDWTR
ncbi:type II toxin-antitoxin system VapC family toxin [Sphingobium sp. YR768]|uniref:type II toxin-antitoxin system VapC family toxin n=1 Tax=Sphingobium sp. YR768 TaxID=1884365 RepID=UPI0008C0B83F|nr:type II toxin-antitoxin system VapC family toxin [Sphingobium sp. YR768]SEQ93155.1 tRNA(fMet)-specific endonuclease VapC [Sphingobium sp. YR768]